jgi:hypothetical protein
VICAAGAIKRQAEAASRPWEQGDKLSRVLGQRRDTPGNQKWSGRWESNTSLATHYSFKIIALQASTVAACDFRVKTLL